MKLRRLAIFGLNRAKVTASDGVISTKMIIGKDGAEMVLIPAGEFTMGSPQGEGEIDEYPQLFTLTPFT
jgi:formylglycine-generating enzyme required for sulfatase activity